ncbi:MAG: hypothetical protein LM577_08985 [Thermoproteaceae archaeon]|nr:hypothetical protein [Thermoproteaceae archaeon]
MGVKEAELRDAIRLVRGREAYLRRTLGGRLASAILAIADALEGRLAAPGERPPLDLARARECRLCEAAELAWLAMVYLDPFAERVRELAARAAWGPLAEVAREAARLRELAAAVVRQAVQCYRG